MGATFSSSTIELNSKNSFLIRKWWNYFSESVFQIQRVRQTFLRNSDALHNKH